MRWRLADQARSDPGGFGLLVRRGRVPLHRPASRGEIVDQLIAKTTDFISPASSPTGRKAGHLHRPGAGSRLKVVREGHKKLSDTLDRKLNGLRLLDRLSLGDAAYFVQKQFDISIWNDALKIVVQEVKKGRFAAQVIGDGHPKPWTQTHFGEPDTLETTIATSDLLAWLSNHTDAAQTTRPVGNWPWGNHETELLRQLANAARLFWINYDPTDPSTAPTNEQVKNWLVNKGVAPRTAEIMATILRADGLRPGPRK